MSKKTRIRYRNTDIIQILIQSQRMKYIKENQFPKMTHSPALRRSEGNTLRYFTVLSTFFNDIINVEIIRQVSFTEFTKSIIQVNKSVF